MPHHRPALGVGVVVGGVCAASRLALGGPVVLQTGKTPASGLGTY